MRLLFTILKITLLVASIAFIAFFIGLFSAFLPPTASIAIIGMFGLILLWAMPELRMTPLRSLKTALFVFIVVQLAVPWYYAVQVPGLPWISIRRLATVIFLVLFGIVVAGSNKSRQKIVDSLHSGGFISICALGYLIISSASIFSSVDAPQSISALFDLLMSSYAPFFACLLLIETQSDVEIVVMLITAASVAVAVTGLTEYFTQHRVALDAMPDALKSQLMSDNPSFAILAHMNPFRNGRYRASSIFSVPLSYGEFGAMILPIGLYYVMHARNISIRTFGFVVFIGALASIFICGSRGAMVATVAAMPVFAFLWVIRNAFISPRSMAGPIFFMLTGLGTVLVVPAIFFVPAIHNIVLGGGETEASNEGRVVQWELAKPKIVENPVTGHGLNMGADVVGYHTEGGQVTLDSFAVTLLAETGVPGLLFFFGIIVFSAWTAARIYITRPTGNEGSQAASRNRFEAPTFPKNEIGALGGSLACSLIALAVNKTVLSQRENMTLLFVIAAVVIITSRLARDGWRRVQAGNETKLDPAIGGQCGSVPASGGGYPRGAPAYHRKR